MPGPLASNPYPVTQPSIRAVALAEVTRAQPKKLSKALPIFGGTTEIQKEIIVRSLGL
jgi:hypothetical protein